MHGLGWIAAAVVGAFALYHGALQGAFVFDDIPLLVHNDCHRGLHRIPGLFDFGSGSTCTLRPMRFVTFAIDHHLWGQDPFGFHLSNVILHALVAVLGGSVLARVAQSPRLGALAGVLFLAHPIATEAVAYISGRRDLLMALFTLLAIDAWLRLRTRFRWWLLPWIAACALFALWSHESAAALPAVLLGLELFRAQPEGRRRRALSLAGLFIGVGSFAAWSVLAHNASKQVGLWGGSLSSHVGTALHGQLHYVQQLLAPVALQADYTPDAFPIAGGLLELWPMLALVGVLGAAVLAWRLRHRAPLVSLAIWSYTVLLAPSSQVLPHHELLAEHRLYLASLVFCGLIAGGLLEAARRLNRPQLAPVSVALLALLYGGLTWARVPDWASEEALWTATLRTAPRSARAHVNVGTIRAEAGRLDEAFGHFSVAVEVRPDLCPAWFNRGLILQMAQRHAEALVSLRRAWACEPKPRWRDRVGKALLQACAVEEARAVLPAGHPAWAPATARCATAAPK